MKRMSLLSRLLLLLIAAALPSSAEKIATIPAPTGYIDDYAGVLSSPAKSDMESLSRELHDKTKAQVFIVTVNTTEGEPVETFANELFAKWKIGEKKTDRGVLLLFAIKDRKRWIEVGYGLEGILNDAKAGDIGRDMVPALQAANYDEATKLGMTEICRIIAADSGVTLDGLADSSEPIDQDSAPAPVEAAPRSGNSTGFMVLLLSGLFGPALVVMSLIFLLRRSLRRRGTVISGWDGGRSLSDRGSSFDSDSGFGGSDDSFGGGDGGGSGGGGAGGGW